MNYLIAFLTTASLATAISISDYVPECSVKCLTDGIDQATNCSQEDVACQCIVDNYLAIYQAATQCVIDACGADVATKEVVHGGQQFCADVAMSPSGTFSSPPFLPSGDASSAETISHATTEAPSSTPGASESSSPSSLASNGSSATPSASSSDDATTTQAPSNSAAQSSATPASTGAAQKIGAGVVPALGALAAYIL